MCDGDTIDERNCIKNFERVVKNLRSASEILKLAWISNGVGTMILWRPILEWLYDFDPVEF
jgi:hypothetical protein